VVNYYLHFWIACGKSATLRFARETICAQSYLVAEADFSFAALFL
jgi:hypothetical protein